MDIIIVEETILEAAREIRDKTAELDDVFKKYLTLVSQLQNNVFKSGEVNEALGAYLEYARLLKGNISGIGSNAKIVIDNYIVKTDEADQYLF